ncbi:hypothetical protein HK405_012369, partial [Cladochytrium tenue]
MDLVATLTDRVFGPPRLASAADVPRLDGRHAIVTGASAGLGKASAAALAAKGAHVVLACRNVSKGEAVAAEIRSLSPGAQVKVHQLDLADLASVRRFAETYRSEAAARPQPQQLHLLLNNAGVMAPPAFTRSVDGVELQMAANHLGHFYLTLLLLPLLEATAAADRAVDVRIVNVSSVGHFATTKGGIDFDNINNPATYNAYVYYGQSKLANILFTRELQKRLDKKGHDNIYVNAANPGPVGTNLFDQASYVAALQVPVRMVFPSPARGALTQLYAATHPDIVEQRLKAQYFSPVAALARPSDFALDDALAAGLWKWSEET